jgi:hypothetical protein
MVAFLAACDAPSEGPEAELRDWVERGVAATEGKRRSVLVDMISPDYADARGYNRDRVEDVLRAYFFRMNKIELLTTIDEITVSDDSAAELLVTVGMAGSHDGLLGFSADAYQFSLELIKNGEDWTLISARWAQLGDDLR